MSIDFVTELRKDYTWILLLLPVGGIVITFMYSWCKSRYGKLDTNRVLDSVHGEEKVPLILLPLIFTASVITHLVGGSAGREGAALQLGGSIGYRIGKTIHLDKDDMHIIVMSGMSAVFAALFGTPLAAAVFALEVSSVGLMYYAALLPCVIASASAYGVSLFLGVEPVRFAPVVVESFSLGFGGGIFLLSVLCALVSILFCVCIKRVEHHADKLNPYVRAAVGGVLLLAMTALLRTTDYNGAGMEVVERALHGNAHYAAFALKIIFTSVTIAAGFKGGEIVPAFFVGSTFGCVVAPVLGLDASLGAAVGFVALFCGVVNCPIASLMLALEVFGSDSVLMFAVVCAVSYTMSGNFGLYKSQKLLYSKINLHYIDVNAL
ncbi:MAG: chloride channel protein [Clostridia bacterium]|nr:chloride channel protein [Clostridia bacterium]